MPNSINLLSPSFRDYLLLKNLVTDTVVDNGLESLLGGIGKPTEIETTPNAVQPSNSISNTGPVYQELNTILNQYQGTENDYTQVDIVFNNSINSTITQSGPYTSNNELLNGKFYYNGNFVNSESIRQDLTSKNIYVDKPKQSVINLNTQPVPTYQNLTSYLDENNNLNVGGPSTQAADILASIASGQGVGLNINGGGASLVANEDIRSTLVGRVLGATGVINDTPLGNIGGQQLLAHVGYNAAFGLQQETLGSLNLNPLTLLQGKPLVTLNYSVTTPDGAVGKVLNFAANVLGVQSPVSLLKQSIYTFDDKGGFIGIGNIERGNEIIKNTGKGQVYSLFDNLKRNTNIANPYGLTLRQGYAPGYKDDRKAKGENIGDGLNPFLYARDNDKGEIIDFLNGEKNTPVSSGNYERSRQIENDGWDKDYFRKNDYNSQKGDQAKLYKDAWGWGDAFYNYDGNVQLNSGSDTLFTGTEKNKKSLLYKTQQLFSSDHMRTLITGHGVKDGNKGQSQINSSVSSVGGYTSKGSGVMSKSAILDGVNNGPENVFCRTWTTYDRYSQVLDLQKSRGLYGGGKNSVIFRRNVEFSVLENNGFARVAPYKTDKMAQIVDAEGVTGAGNKMKTYRGDTDNKRYMFSIENLAWNDNLVNLLPCEVGPGDPLSNHRGRIMWFPPYDINFSETTSASWDKHNFIGRGEPIYTYNNTERSGNLSWKIIIDHPNYLNFIGKATGITPENYDDFLASYFAGCIPQEDLQSLLTQEEIVKTEVVNVEKKPEIKKEPDVEPPSFDVYFPNDVYDINKYPEYEDGKCKDETNKNLLFTLTGHTNIVVTSEFNKDSSKVVTASFDNTAKIFDTTNGNSLFKLSGHTDVLTSSKFSNDGSKVVTASMDNTAKIWDSSTGNLLFTLAGHTDGINYAEFNSDGSKIVTASYDNTAKIWNASNGSLLFTLIGHTDFVNYAKFNPSGTKVITGSNDFYAKIWDVSNGAQLFSLSGDGAVLTVEFNSSDTKVLTASDDNVVKIFDTSNGNLLFTLNDTSSVAKFNSDGTKIATPSNNNAKIFDTSNGNLLFTLTGHENIVRNVDFSSDNTKIATASNDNTSKIWNLSNGELLVTLEGHENEVNTVKFNSDNSKVVTASNDNTAKIWKAEKTECFIDRKTNVTGEGNGIGDYFELCYQFKVDGKDKWSSEKCTSTNGPKGGNGRLEPDRTNFGLNASGTTKEFKSARIGDKKYALGFRDPEYAKDLQTYLSTKCQSCKVEVVGYASDVGTFGDDRNSALSKLRAESVVDWLKKNVLTNSPFTDRINIKSAGKGATDGRGECPKSPSSRNKDYTKSKNDVYGCKANRYVTVTFVPDPNLAKKEEPPKEPEKIPDPPKTPNLPISRFYSECDYFEKLSLTDPTTYDTIRQKVKFFQPAFHSTTPEGFNSRLTFLQQCMRQGPTLGAGATNNPNNLAFGRPPICILRIGDFYHTKIVIENISFNFEPLVWDLNPEGVGVQPMICNVDMSFSFIGGSSLRGPINRLQNAVSFNYYANTEIYDPRADTIKITEGSSSGVTVDGIKTIAADYNVSPEAQQIAGLTAQVEPNINQLNQNANANAGAQPLTTNSGSTSGDTVNNSTDPDDTLFSNSLVFGNFIFTIGYSGTKLKGRFGIVSAAKLTKEYDAKVSLITASGNIDIATFKIGKENYGDYLSVNDGWRTALMTASETDLSPSTSNTKKSNVIFQIEVLDLKYKFYEDRAIAQFECPEEDISIGDIVSSSDWNYILKDPCCACWPNGTGNKDIIINGVKCPTSGCTI
jgi:WD40 repeat protein